MDRRDYYKYFNSVVEVGVKVESPAHKFDRRITVQYEKGDKYFEQYFYTLKEARMFAKKAIRGGCKNVELWEESK